MRVVVGHDEEVLSGVCVEVFDVSRRPRRQLLMQSEATTATTPDVDRRLGRTVRTRAAVISHRQVQLHSCTVMTASVRTGVRTRAAVISHGQVQLHSYTVMTASVRTAVRPDQSCRD